MRNTATRIAVAAVMMIIAASCVGAVEVGADSFGTVWRGRPVPPNPPNYYSDLSRCDFAKLSPTLDSTAHGYSIFNLTNVTSATSCTLTFAYEKRAGWNDPNVDIYYAGTSVARGLQARFDALATGTLLGSVSLSGNKTYICTFPAGRLPLGSNYVFLGWSTTTASSWGCSLYWTMSNQVLTFH